jgi:hypothetical protein
MKKSILVILLLQISSICFCQTADKSFVDFWKVFRNAALKNDYKSLDSFTKFPLIVKGTLDSDPIKKFNRDKFQFVFKNYLKQDNANMSGTDLDDIQSKKVISNSDFKDAVKNEIRISDMVFEKVKGSWKLILLYINTEFQEENKIK